MLLLLLLACLSACGEEGAPLQRFEYERVLMGTHMRIALYAVDERTATEAAEAAFAEVEATDRAISSWREDSAWKRIRAETPGQVVDAPGHLWRCLLTADALYRDTAGVVDIGAAAVIRLWREARSTGRLPTPEQLAAAKARSPSQRVEARAEDARFSAPVVIGKDADLDFGSIGKGHAAFEAGWGLRSLGVPVYLIDFGGDMCFGDPPPGRDGWRVSVPGWPEPLELRNTCLASSGDGEQHVEIDGVRYSHIVDPRTGLGVTHGYDVTVISTLGAYADGMATALSILGTENQTLLAPKPWIALIAKDGEVVWKSPTWPRLPTRGE